MPEARFQPGQSDCEVFLTTRLLFPEYISGHLPHPHAAASTRTHEHAHKYMQPPAARRSRRDLPQVRTLTPPRTQPLRHKPPDRNTSSRNQALVRTRRGGVRRARPPLAAACWGTRASALGPLQHGVAHQGSGRMMVRSSAEPWKGKAGDSGWCGQGHSDANPLPCLLGPPNGQRPLGCVVQAVSVTLPPHRPEPSPAPGFSSFQL